MFARFEDEAPESDSAPVWADDLFDPGLPGSLAHFYHTMSSGQFEITGTVLPRRYASTLGADAYTQADSSGFGGYGLFAHEILEQVGEDVDLALFDNDGPDGVPNSGDDDGAVDYVFINTLSAPRGFLLAAGTGISSLGGSFSSGDAGMAGNIQVEDERGSVQQEGTFSQTVGVMAHEFGHHLGLPDLYDLVYDDPEEDSAGIGKWGLMGWGAHGWNGDDGPTPFSAWSLEQLGWIGPDNDRLVIVDEDRSELETADHFAGGTLARIPLRVASFSTSGPIGEYLLLEQRTRDGTYYNRGLPGEGMLIWHVKEYGNSNGNERDKLVDLPTADGLFADAGFPLGTQPDSAHGLDNLDFWTHDEAMVLDSALRMVFWRFCRPAG